MDVNDLGGGVVSEIDVVETSRLTTQDCTESVRCNRSSIGCFENRNIEGFLISELDTAGHDTRGSGF